MSPYLDKFILPVLQALLALFAIILCDRLVNRLLEKYSTRNFFRHVSKGLVHGLARGFIIGIGLLIYLDSIGVSITPILASLGIGSLAIGLALQDTLSNLFSGLYVTIDRPVQVGDMVRLESGQEGTVDDVGWRSTRILTPAGNVVIIPNSKLMGSAMTNFNLPHADLVVTIDVGVAYDSDLTFVERVTLETAKAVSKEVLGAVKDFEPAVWFHTFADSGINMTVVLRAKSFFDQAPLKHAFIKAIHARFKKENIVIPYPVRTLEFSASSQKSLFNPSK